MPTSLVWFRRDLRLDDNPALLQAARRGAIVPVFLWSPGEDGRWVPGGASRWWLHHSLASLDASLRALGSRLVVVATEDSLATLRELARLTGADAVYWNRRYEPSAIARDKRVKQALSEDGLVVESFNGSLLHEPWQVETKTGTCFQVFTPFWKAALLREVGAPQSAPLRLEAPAAWPAQSVSIESLGLLPKLGWAAGFSKEWTPGELGAAERMRRFLAEAQTGYGERRDFPGERGTSRLSPHLHFGELSPRRVWAASVEAGGDLNKGAGHFRRELGWREFSHHLLYHFPSTPVEPLRAHYAAFPWEPDEKLLRAWQRGRTGYPIVDAGMRELWTTGWMHNRVRMIVASLLVKHMLQPWLDGADWFWDTLVDADLAQNTQGWQWTAGCGADAAPYFRIFNPVLQGEKFDPDGAYVRRWCPELAKVPASVIHKPWEAGDLLLRGCGVRLGDNYPAPIIDHDKGRARALAALEKLGAPK